MKSARVSEAPVPPNTITPPPCFQELTIGPTTMLANIELWKAAFQSEGTGGTKGQGGGGARTDDADESSKALPPSPHTFSGFRSARRWEEGADLWEFPIMREKVCLDLRNFF